MIDWRTMIYILYCIPMWVVAFPLFMVRKIRPFGIAYDALVRFDEKVQKVLKPSM